MELQHRFEVPVGIDRAWESLLDMEQVAACFPGATLTSADGEEYTGSVKVKLGPIQLTYQGSARIVEADESAHRAVIDASGRAARSGSTATMKVTAVATAVDDDKTAVTMDTDLTITGRPAQFGRGVMVEVGNKILGRFADCLSSKLSGSEGAGAEAGAAGAGAAGAGSAEAGAAGSGGAATSEAGADAARSGSDSPSTAQASEAGDTAASDAAPSQSSPTFTRAPEPIDLLESAGTPVLKRLAPVIGGIVLLLLLRRLFKRRSSDESED